MIIAGVSIGRKSCRLLPTLALTLLAAAPVLLAAGLNRTLWRFTSLVDYLRVAMTVVAIILRAVAQACSTICPNRKSSHYSDRPLVERRPKRSAQSTH